MVSLYIVSKNHEQYISKCIKSALQQTYYNIEIFIIDDYSTDRTMPKIKKLYLVKNIKFYKINFLGLQKIANKVIDNLVNILFD